jgi:hypothetical protein
MCFCKQHYKINDVYVTGGKSNWVQTTQNIHHLDNAISLGYDLITN